MYFKKKSFSVLVSGQVHPQYLVTEFPLRCIPISNPCSRVLSYWKLLSEDGCGV